MLLREGENRSIRVDMSLALSLAAVAGAVNTAAFRAVGYFSANMTGNVSAVSDHLAAAQWPLVLVFLAIVLAFALGAMASTLLIGIGRRRAVRGVFAYSILLEGVLLGLLGAADLFVPTISGSYSLVIGLGFLMGLQNAATTLISNARVRTTHVSGMLTDLSIEVAQILEPVELSDRRDTMARLRLHAITLGAFVAGGVLGAGFYMVAGGLVFVVAALVLVVMALPYVHRSRRTATVRTPSS